MLVLFLLVFALTGQSASVQATEGGGEGQVNRGGKITFYEETQVSSTTESSTTQVGTPSESPRSEKPKGRLPSTGEVLQQYGWIGLALVILGCLMFLRKSRKGAPK